MDALSIGYCPKPRLDGVLESRGMLHNRRGRSPRRLCNIPSGSTKFTLFETVTSLVPPTSRGARSASLPAASTCTLNHPNTKINFAINKEVRARGREGCVCLFVPWPEEEVVVQQGYQCSGAWIVPMSSRPTAKVRALIFGLFQIMRIHPYGGRLISIVGSRFKVI